ncbi:MAG: hypothetical protein LBB88_06445 [Planctomycetaceae bacterium]|jgi:hypothetical protein|nr:hypothetical protein [Planctomycetaceae bacterium]
MADSIVQALIRQGLQQGREEGREEELKKFIPMCLGKRFNSFVPRDIQDSVNSYSDLIALESLLQRAWDCESIDEFREYLVR